MSDEQSIEEEIARTLSGGWDEADARDAAAALSPLLNRVRAEALREVADRYWEHEGQNPVTEACLMAADRLAPRADRIEQNSEGSET